MAGCSEKDNETSGKIKGGEFAECLITFQGKLYSSMLFDLFINSVRISQKTHHFCIIKTN
jgi:hypothetical protein